MRVYGNMELKASSYLCNFECTSHITNDEFFQVAAFLVLLCNLFFEKLVRLDKFLCKKIFSESVVILTLSSSTYCQKAQIFNFIFCFIS